MFIGAYLCTGALFLAMGAVVVSKGWFSARAASDDRIGWRLYLVISLTAMVAGLVIFIALSLALGILHTGGAGSWSYPQDYLAGGPIAWIAMLIPVVGLVAPLLLAIFAKPRMSKGGNPNPST